MKPAVKRQFAFIGRSMLWSLLLYVVMMVMFNWDEVRNTIRGSNRITIVSGSLPTLPAGSEQGVTHASIAHQAGIISNLILLAKDISGIAAHIPVQY